jgi:hypothetical protein
LVVVNSIVLTDPAREGLFRYFPGVPNAGATAGCPRWISLAIPENLPTQREICNLYRFSEETRTGWLPIPAGSSRKSLDGIAASKQL